MNDAASVSSLSYSSSSQSNSLNRSSNSSYLMSMAATSHSCAVEPPSSARTVINHLGVSSSSGGTSPELPVRRRRPRAKSQTPLPLVHFPEAASSTTRPVSLNDANSAASIISSSLIEHNKQLMEDLFELKRQLKHKDDEIEKLVEIRNKLDSEMQELSASLFEQAYLMVNSARAEAAQSEKLLKEANGKIDVLQAEVKALKELVLNTTTITSSTPNKKNGITGSSNSLKPSSHSRQSSLNQQSMNFLAAPALSSSSAPATILQVAPSQQPTSLKHSGPSYHLLPTLGKGSNEPAPQPQLKDVGKHHRRLPSDQAKSFIDKLFHSSSSSLNSSSGSQKLERKLLKEKFDSLERTGSIEVNEYEKEAVEHDSVYFDELVEWLKKPELVDKSSSFLTRICGEDILPCLSFNNPTLTDELLASIQGNYVCIEDISNNSVDLSQNKMCGLSNVPAYCQYKIKFSENGQWIYISRLTRNRIISVCDFFTYLRYIKDGLVKSGVSEIYWNIIDLRRKMSLSRLGL